MRLATRLARRRFFAEYSRILVSLPIETSLSATFISGLSYRQTSSAPIEALLVLPASPMVVFISFSRIVSNSSMPGCPMAPSA